MIHTMATYAFPNIVSVSAFHGNLNANAFAIHMPPQTIFRNHDIMSNADQELLRILDILKDRSRIVRCSSAPSTSRLSASEKRATILFLWESAISSELMMVWYSCCVCVLASITFCECEGRKETYLRDDLCATPPVCHHINDYFGYSFVDNSS